MPFRNVQPPSLDGFIPGEDYDFQQDRLELLTGEGENLTVLYGTMHGARWIGVDGRCAPHGNWPREVREQIGDAWEDTEVTINPDSGIIEISRHDVIYLESVSPVMSIIQTRHPRNSRIQLRGLREGRPRS